MASIFKKRSDGYLKKMLKNDKLFNHLMKYGYFPESWVLPPFIEIKLKKNGAGDVKDRKQITLFAPKSNLKWREFSFLHPNNYQKICDVIRKNDFINVISEISKGKKIWSYSLPQKFNNIGERSGSQIMQWLDLQEDIALVSYNYPFILIVDVSNCYHSMYTHAIEWACESVGYKKLGSEIDCSLRRGMNNRTHGLPVGPRISDYIAEIVLCAVDREIEKKSITMKEFCGGRFKDNYYLLCKSKNQAENLLKIISKCLRKYHQSINSDKTKMIETHSYLDNFWQINYDVLIRQFNFDKDNIHKIELKKLILFISIVSRTSESLNNDRAVIEKAIALLDQLRPIKTKASYSQYFSHICRLYKDRTPAMPRILALLCKLANEDGRCFTIFKNFLLKRFWVAYNADDEFEVLWISYFLSQIKHENKKIAEKLLGNENILYQLMGEYYKNAITGKINNDDLAIKLWPNEKNNSMATIHFSVIQSQADFSKIVSVKFPSFIS